MSMITCELQGTRHENHAYKPCISDITDPFVITPMLLACMEFTIRDCYYFDPS